MILLHDLTDFLRLSAALHMQLSAENILQLITNHAPLEQPGDREVLLQVFEYLSDAYGMRKRLVGPPAILHPLRATALLNMVARMPRWTTMIR